MLKAYRDAAHVAERHLNTKSFARFEQRGGMLLLDQHIGTSDPHSTQIQASGLGRTKTLSDQYTRSAQLFGRDGQQRVRNAFSNITGWQLVLHFPGLLLIQCIACIL